MNLLKTSELLRSYSMAHPECKFNSTDLLKLKMIQLFHLNMEQYQWLINLKNQ